MKVISIPDPNWSKRVTCSSCLAVLEVQASDLTWSSDRDGVLMGTSCVNCRAQIWLYDSDVPKHIQNKMKRE